MRPVIMFDMDETLLHTYCSSSESMSAEDEVKATASKNREAAIKGYVEGSAGKIKMAEARNRLADQYEALAHALSKAPKLDAKYSANKDCRVLINPEAMTAISSAAQFADIVVFTAATREYAEDALAKVGLSQFFIYPAPGNSRKIINNVFCLDENPDLINTTNTPWVLIDDTPAISKVKQVYPESKSESWQDMVIQVNAFNEFNVVAGNGLLAAVSEALKRVTSIDWGKRCPISGKRTGMMGSTNPARANQFSALSGDAANTPTTTLKNPLASIKHPQVVYCCAEHKNKYDGKI